MLDSRKKMLEIQNNSLGQPQPIVKPDQDNLKPNMHVSCLCCILLACLALHANHKIRLLICLLICFGGIMHYVKVKRITRQDVQGNKETSLKHLTLFETLY